MTKHFKFGRTATSLALSGALVAGLSASAFMNRPEAEVQRVKLDIPVDQTPVDRQSTENSYSPVIKRVSPGVVQVFTSAKAERTSGPAAGGMDEWLRRFLPEGWERNLPRQFGPRQQGIGSGVVVSEEGYILTNNHVVDGADRVRVSLQDGRELDAKVVGTDPKTDIAVLKVDAGDLPTVPMADSDKVEIGDVVLAIGNPFGIGQTVTSGIVSATGRANIGLDYEDFIQTDAAINPGNSGGALVDSKGRLIGINTAILSRSGGNQGIGFAIPANLARSVMEQIVETGSVSRGYLGVMIQDVTPALAKEFKLKDARGALVGDVTPRSPAEKAGLKSGDVILEVNGKTVSDSRRLRLAVANMRPGETATLKVLRDGANREMKVTVRPMPGSQEVAKSGGATPQESGLLSGVSIDDLTPSVRQAMKLPNTLKGVVISQVEPNTPAAEAGLQRGDVILEINRKAVASSDEALALTEKQEDKRALLRVWRDGGSRFVVVDETQAG